MQPLFPSDSTRAAGVLLHPTSLPSALGVGNFGEDAHRFIDFLADAGMQYWQVCPMGPTGFGDSPYQAFSAFAGSPYLIDLYPLKDAGLLRDEDLHPLHALSRERVDYGGLYYHFWPILRKAFAAFQETPDALKHYGAFEAFEKTHAHWLIPYAAFMTLKEHFEGKPWHTWDGPYSSFSKASKSPLIQEKMGDIAFHQFTQYVFFGQWQALRAYAESKGVQFIGDIPIFVALDSADVWAHPALFELDISGKPTAVAGVPPDYFSKTGQLWGNPLYNWKVHQEEKYSWWIDRLKSSFELYDIVRLDHFRGFCDYWAVKAGAETAAEGEWRQGPGLDFFKAVRKALPKARFIAEDLGNINDDVRALLEATGLPGMAILQFAFGGDAKNLYLPHNLSANQVVYPGTHDNDSTHNWYRCGSEHMQDHVRRYLRVSGQDIAWDLIRKSYESPCMLAIVPMQDILGLCQDARMNTPGAPEGNWQWRMTRGQQNEAWQRTPYLRDLALLYDRTR